MADVVGHQPKPGFTVRLARDTDFFFNIRRADGSTWPTGAVVKVNIGRTASWAAVLSGSTGSVNIDKVQVNAVVDSIGGERTRATVSYTDASGLDVVTNTGWGAWS